MADKKKTKFKISDERLKELWGKIKMSEALLSNELEPTLRENIRRYTGVHVPSIGSYWDVILNEVYPIIQTQIPSIFFKTPKGFLKPKNKTYLIKKNNPQTGKKEEIQVDSTKSAQTQEAILNYDLEQMKYKKQAKRVLLDALLYLYGVMWHGYKGEFGMTEEQGLTVRDDKPFVTRISPLRFVYDPCVTIADIEDGEFVGRIIDIPVRDVIEDDKLNVSKSLKGKFGFGQKVSGKDSAGIEQKQGGDNARSVSKSKSLIDHAGKDFKNTQGAKFVRVYEVFLRPTKKEKRDGGKGTILLLTDEQKEPLRENPWSIKAEGFPGKVLQFNEIVDTYFGLSDIDVYKHLVDQKNLVINQQIENAQETSKTYVGVSEEDADEESVDKLVQGDNTIVRFKSGNPRDRMFIASGASAASQELYQVDGRIQTNLDNASGVNDLKRGVLRSGEESAFSVKQRSLGSAARPAHRQDMMVDFLKESFTYINQLEKQFIPFKDAVRIIGSLDLVWSEDMSREELQAETDVEIDVTSMLNENPEEELGRLTETLQLMVQGLTIPEVRTKILQEGKMINIAPLIQHILMRQKIRDPEIFRNIKPEESEGFVSVKEIREAKKNVDAALTGVEVPFPPTEEDDHVAKLEVYSSIKDLLTKAQQQSAVLDQLIQIQSALLAEADSKEAGAGKPSGLKNDKPKVF